MIGNVILLGAWQLLTLVAVPKKRIGSNTAENLRVLRAADSIADATDTDRMLAAADKQAVGVRIEPMAYIENQPKLGSLKFGRGFDFEYGGCSVIAVYNMLLSLGEQVSGETLCKIAEDLQRRGVALGGRFGVAPLSLKGYLKRYARKKGFRLKSTCSSRAEILDALGEQSDAVLVVLWNGKRLRDQFHAMHIEKRKGGFIIHNACYLKDQKYAEMGPYGSLSAAINGYGPGRAKAALTIGIKRQ